MITQQTKSEHNAHICKPWKRAGKMKNKTMHIRNQKEKESSLLKRSSDENIELAKHVRFHKYQEEFMTKIIKFYQQQKIYTNTLKLE